VTLTPDALAEKRLVLYFVVDAHEDSAWHSKPALKIRLGDRGRLAVGVPVVAQIVAEPKDDAPIHFCRAHSNRQAVPLPSTVTTVEPPHQLHQPMMMGHCHRKARDEVVLPHRTSHIG